MSQFEVIQDIACKVLRGGGVGTRADNSLWDRTCRIVRTVERISKLPEIAEADIPIDNTVLSTAALFSEAGQLESHFNGSEEAPGVGETDPEELADLARGIASENLRGHFPEHIIEKICRVIMDVNNRFTELTEARIISDAKGLEDVGSIGIFNEFRRSVNQGKGVVDVLEGWKRKTDYGYWQARLRDGFHFEAVRLIAKRRVDSAGEFMSRLSAENLARDLDEVIIDNIQ